MTSIKLFKKNNHKRGENSSIDHLLTIYRLNKNYGKSLLLKDEAIKSTKLVKGDLAKLYTEIGYIYGKIKDYKKADYYFNLGKKEYKNQLKKGTFYFEKRAEIYAESNRYKEAYKYSIILDSIEQVLVNERFKNKISKLETKYQTQQKENEILRLSNENNKHKIIMAQTRLFIVIGLGLILAVALIIYFRWRKKQQEQQLKILEKTIEASDNEKNRIGRELHDGVASKIIQLANSAENLNIQYTSELHGIYNEIRNLSHQLNNTPTHDNEPIFERFFELKEDVKNQTVNLKIKPVSLVVKEPTATHLYRIAQELITNSIKHANSTIINVEVIQEKKQLQLTYSDNGEKIDFENIKKGNGLKNIEHRVSLMKGTIAYNPEKTKGFSVIINIPL